MKTYTRRLTPHELKQWQARRPLLSRLDIELTERCNNVCIHCLINRPEHDTSAKAAEVDTVFVKDVLEQAMTLGCLTVRFTGGEPLLRDDFEELYLFTRRLGMYVIIFTNGRCISSHLAEVLARVPPGRPIEITVYGMHPRSYYAVTGAKLGCAELRRGVELLRQRNIPFNVKGALLPPNRGEMEEFEAWAAGIPWMDEPPGYSMNFDLRARRDDPAKNRRIEKLRLPPKETLTVLTRNPAYSRITREFCGKFMRPPGDKLFWCGTGYAPSMDAYGMLQPCLALRCPATLCDLRSTSLHSALTEFLPRLHETRATNPTYLDRCARCFLMGLCQQCPAKSWTEHGALDTPVEYFCSVAHAEARCLGLVAEHENGWDVVDWEARVQAMRVCSATGTQSGGS